MSMSSKYFILFFLLSYCVMSQNKGLKCGMYGKMTVDERRNTFPFNKAKKVYLVAFPSKFSPIVIEETGDNVKYDSLSYSKLGYKIINTIKLPNKYQSEYLITEKLELNQLQVDTLSNLLLNYKIKNRKLPKKLALSVIGCYYPRNAVLFVDENEKIISYIEVCFECMQFYQGPDETIENFNILANLEECFGRVELLKDFFKDCKIEYGVEEN
jgi:hypothetical protein